MSFLSKVSTEVDQIQSLFVKWWVVVGRKLFSAVVAAKDDVMASQLFPIDARNGRLNVLH